jgi:hypothetical protein
LRALSWILAPIWLAQILTTRKSFAINPILGSVRFNAAGLHVWRAKLAHRITARRRARLAQRVRDDERREFERDGYVVRRDFVKADTFDALVSEIENYSGEYLEYREGDAVTRRYAITPRVLQQLPICRSVVESDEWRRVTKFISSYDAEPPLFIQVVFSKQGGERSDPQTNFHMDTFHPTMKAWLYLCDVPKERGPLTYVAGSHRLDRRRLAWQKRKSVAASKKGGPKGGAFRVGVGELPRLRLPQPTLFETSRNTLIVADTGGFHARGPSSEPSTRLEIYASSRRNPFFPWVGFDIWSTPMLRHRKMSLLFLAVRLLNRLGLRRSLPRSGIGRPRVRGPAA